MDYATLKSMKTIVLTSVLLLLINSATFAGTTAGRLNQAAQSLDDTIKKVDITEVSTELAKVLKVENATLTKAVGESKCSLSDVALANFIAEKKNKPIETFLKAEQNWMDVLKASEIPENEAEEYLDSVQSEIAFALLDFKPKKKK